MAEIKIEPTQPIIASKPLMGRPPIYPFGKLKEVGMSFWVSSDNTKWTAIYNAVYRQNKKGKPQFVVTKGDLDKRAGWRVQRTE